MTFHFKLNNKKLPEPIKDTRPVAFFADRLYLPVNKVKDELVVEEFDKMIFNQKMCNRCEIFKTGERFSEMCSTCDGFKGRFKLYEEVEIKDIDYYAVPAGDLKNVQEKLEIDLNKFNIVDKRSDVKAKHPLTFTGKLYTGQEIINGEKTPNQVKLLKEFAITKEGIIEAPPRTGKTVVGVRILCGFKRRTLIIAHERQLLRQYFGTLLSMTNLRELRKQTGKKIAGIIQTEKDWEEDWDYVLVNYQKFITTKGFERIKKYVVNKFGLLEVDECHHAAAKSYTNFIAKLNMRRKIGLSATTTRKDMMHFIMHHYLGPVVARSSKANTPPQVYIIDTQLKPKTEWRGKLAYLRANQWLAGNKERNKLIVKNIFEDLRSNPKHNIIIPVMFVEQARLFSDLINRQAAFNNENKNEKWSDTLAQPYHGKINVTEALNRAREATEIRVTFAIRKMMKEGLNVPAWSHLYLIFPMNNEEDFYQMTQRVCTVYEGKPQPVLKIFVDNIGLSLGCFIPTWYNGVLKNKYKISDQTYKQAELIIARKNKPQEEDLDLW